MPSFKQIHDLIMDNEGCIVEFEEKPLVANSNTVSTGIYIIRRRQLIDLIERCAEENRYDFVTDILVRYKNLKKIYGYKIEDYWSNIATAEALIHSLERGDLDWREMIRPKRTFK